MAAFVSVASARLSQRSSFTSQPSSYKPATPLKFHYAVASKSSSRALVRMNLDEDDDEAGGVPVTNQDRTKLFVGNLSWSTTEESLKEAFAEHGEVVGVRIVTDRYTGRSRGFGFIEYDAASEASKALKDMDGVDIDGRNVRVDRATPRKTQRFRPRNDDYY